MAMRIRLKNKNNQKACGKETKQRWEKSLSIIHNFHYGFRF